MRAVLPTRLSPTTTTVHAISLDNFRFVIVHLFENGYQNKALIFFLQLYASLHRQSLHLKPLFVEGHAGTSWSTGFSILASLCVKRGSPFRLNFAPDAAHPLGVLAKQKLNFALSFFM
jgi:hypothetical protein